MVILFQSPRCYRIEYSVTFRPRRIPKNGRFTLRMRHKIRDSRYRSLGCTVIAPGFTKVQALDIDSFGRLHVLDNHAASVMIFDSVDGTFLGSYGEYGTGAGYLRLPMDVLISETNTAIVTTGDGDRIEVFSIP